MSNMVGRMGNLGSQATLKFMHALCSGFEVGPTVGDAHFDGLVVAQLKMQGLETDVAPPIASHKVLTPVKAQRCRDQPAVLFG